MSKVSASLLWCPRCQPLCCGVQGVSFFAVVSKVSVSSLWCPRCQLLRCGVQCVSFFVLSEYGIQGYFLVVCTVFERHFQKCFQAKSRGILELLDSLIVVLLFSNFQQGGWLARPFVCGRQRPEDRSGRCHCVFPPPPFHSKSIPVILFFSFFFFFILLFSFYLLFFFSFFFLFFFSSFKLHLVFLFQKFKFSKCILPHPLHNWSHHLRACLKKTMIGYSMHACMHALSDTR